MSFSRIVGAVIVLVPISMALGCAGTEQDLSTEDSPATFVPVVTDYGVDIFVDEIDGKETTFGKLDKALIDPGTHELAIRLEYQPAAGSSVIVGGLANLLLRAGTNKTFKTRLTIDVEAGHVYQISARSNSDDILDVIILDETSSKEILKHSFRLKDGKFERIFRRRSAAQVAQSLESPSVRSWPFPVV